MTLTSANTLSNSTNLFAIGGGLAYGKHIGRGQVVIAPRVDFSLKVKHVMDRVFGNGHPFEVFRPIVQLVSVNMVDRFRGVRFRKESLGNKPVNFSFSGLFHPRISQVALATDGAAKPHGNAEVAIGIQAPLKYAARSSDASKAAGFITGEARDRAPDFCFHKSGFSNEAALRKGLN